MSEIYDVIAGPRHQPYVQWASGVEKFVYFPPPAHPWKHKTLMLYAPATGRA